MPNAHIFSRFGFVSYDGNRHDRILELPAASSIDDAVSGGGLPPLSSEAVRQTTAAHKGRWDDAGPFFEAALLSLPLTRAPSNGAEAEVKAAGAILQWLRRSAAEEFATSREDDEAMLRVLRERLSAEAESGDEEADGEEAIMACVLAYRVQRKRLFEVAVDVLEAHVETHAPEEEQEPQKGGAIQPE